MEFLSRLRKRFGPKTAFVLFTIGFVLMAANPESISFLLLLNTIGVDVFLILIGIQFRHLSAIPLIYARIALSYIASSTSKLTSRVIKRKP